MPLKKVTLALLVALALATLGFLAGRSAFDRGETRAGQPNVGNQLDAIGTQQAVKDREDRFKGELLGIHIAPTVDDIPMEIRDEDQHLTSHGCGPVGLEKAAFLDFPGQLNLPPAYTFSTEDSGGTGRNPWALECDGTVRSRGWDYETLGVEDIPARVTVVRITTKYDTQSVAGSQIAVEEIGGREAVVVKPASDSGLGQRYLFYFPESFGMTVVHTFNLAEAEAAKVAQLVAEATR